MDRDTNLNKAVNPTPRQLGRYPGLSPVDLLGAGSGAPGNYRIITRAGGPVITNAPNGAGSLVYSERGYLAFLPFTNK